MSLPRDLVSLLRTRLRGFVESRRDPRYAVVVPIAFLGNSASGGGCVLNVSARGCCVEADASPKPGEQLKLFLVTPVSQATLVIETGTVWWAERRRFGVEFVTVQPASQELLGQWLVRLAQENT